MKTVAGEHRTRLHNIWWAILVLICGWFGSEIAGAVERDIACAAEPKDTLIEYGDLVFCTLKTLVDTDIYRWEGRAGEQVVVRTRSLTGSVEPCFRLFDPMETLIETSRCANNQFTQQVETTLPEDGTYVILVGDGGSNESGDYRVILERILPPSPSAQPIAAFGLVEEGAIDVLGDIDFFLFNSVGDGGTVEIEARALTGSVEPCLSLYAPAGGAPVATSQCANNQFTQVINHGLATAGLYIARVEDGGTNEAGNYQLTVQCLFGNCPNLGRARSYLDTASLATFSGNHRPEIATLRLERNALSNGTIREASRVIVEDGETGRVIRRIAFFGDGWMPKAIVSLPDMPTSANGVDELAVLAVLDSGKARFRIKDASNRGTLKTVRVFDQRWDIRNMATVPDETDDGILEIAVLAVNKTDGGAVVRIFDPVTGVGIRQFLFPRN